eukprot:TRINITY_DN22595_c1_g1_i1.p1 TRINITY_DN22595_c1_g1~~TRINITY_DN22595_c1_g1_i1.p1  ORF type:complete len:102 (-),score=7.11 TRINITY_DN22595_c1_g1_i1:1156-1461(-)
MQKTQPLYVIWTHLWHPLGFRATHIFLSCNKSASCGNLVLRRWNMYQGTFKIILSYMGLPFKDLNLKDLKLKEVGSQNIWVADSQAKGVTGDILLVDTMHL